MKTSEEEFIRQIKSVFEDYDDGFADRGWAELRKKYPEKENRKLPIWWLSGIAATLLIVVGLFFNDTFEKQHIKLSVKQPKDKTNKDNEVLKTDQKQTYAELKQGQKSTKTLYRDVDTFRKSTSSTKMKGTNEVYIAKTSAVKTIDVPQPIIIKSLDNQNSDVGSSDKTKRDQLGIIAANSNTENNVTTAITELPKNSDATALLKPEKKSTEEFLKEQSKLLAESKKKEDKKNQSITTFDVFTGTFFNYHDNNEAKLSAGLGLNANIKVAKNLVLSVGAGISQNKVSYENKVPAEVTQAMFASKAYAMDLAPLNAGYSATATNDVSFNGRLLSIDLPVAFKFFPTKRQDFYISTGINSSTYLSQKYTYNYSVSNFGVQNGAAQVQKQTEESNLGGFDFANNAIIAIGFNQSLGKNILIFEPYYKPALNTMGNKNLRISSAGINLKFNFSGNNKR
jgi:hypothetical protein